MSDHSSEAHTSGHGSVQSYITGFVLSVILTAIPFWMVMTEAFDKGPTYIAIVVLAIIQIFVHLKYFLHLNFAEGKLDTYSFLFALMIIVMVVALSVWIIYASNAMMM